MHLVETAFQKQYARRRGGDGRLYWPTLSTEGFEIVAERRAGLSDNFAFRGLRPKHHAAMILEGASAGPQAILVPCTCASPRSLRPHN
jgi:hypothetical protein